jgi:hypothetical protein
MRKGVECIRKKPMVTGDDDEMVIGLQGTASSSHPSRVSRKQ